MLGALGRMSYDRFRPAMTALRLLVLLSPLAAGQLDLRPGSPERAALLELARPTVEGELGAPVTFVVKSLERESQWALA